MLASGITVGYDAPFCYDTASATFVLLTGVTAFNVPVSPGISGAWTPPTMVLVGNYVVITHPGYTLTTGPVGTIDLTTNVYAIGNMMQGTTPVLPAAPAAAGSFFGRAWYAVGNTVYFSNTLEPLVQTDSGQQLTLGAATENITAFAPQGISTSTQGILSALVVFKGSSIWQITGDWNFGTTAGGDLALNQLTSTVGCSAPRTVQSTPAGIMFMAVDGIRTIPPLSMIVSEPQPDVVFPFFNCTEVTRACAAYSIDTYRISLDTITTTDVVGRSEYWFALKVGKWSGPHTRPADAIAGLGSSFILAPSGMVGVLEKSNTYSSTNDTFIEDGTPLLITLVSSLIDPQPPMAEKASIEMTTSAVYGSVPYSAQVLDSRGALLAQGTITSVTAPHVWGGSGLAWGTLGILWASIPYNSVIAPLNFSAPLVFKTCQIVITGASGLYFRFGRIDFRYEAMQYTGAG
jgi:hypothetical protein